MSAAFELALEGKTDALEAELARDAALVNAVDPDTGYSLLHAAVSRRHDRTVTLLLSRGVDTALQTLGGKTALDIANAKGFADIAALLLKDSGSFKDKASRRGSRPPPPMGPPASAVQLDEMRGACVFALLSVANTQPVAAVWDVVGAWNADHCRGFLARADRGALPATSLPPSSSSVDAPKGSGPQTP